MYTCHHRLSLFTVTECHRMSDIMSPQSLSHMPFWCVGQFLFAHWKRTHIGALVANALYCCCMKYSCLRYLSNDRSLRAMHVLGERCAKSCPRVQIYSRKLAYKHKIRLESASNHSRFTQHTSLGHDILDRAGFSDPCARKRKLTIVRENDGHAALVASVELHFVVIA